MITMDEFSVYRFYLALKLHFTTDQYDVIKQKGKIRATKQAFYKRKDLGTLKRIAKNYNDEEVVNFLVANFVSGDRWGGIFDEQANETYTTWKKRIESLTYIYTNDLNTLVMDFEQQKLNFDTLFNSNSDSHPYIIRHYLGKRISIETMVILDIIFNFTEKFDVDLKNDVIWPDLSRLIKKYKPFLKLDIEKYNGITRNSLGHYYPENF